MAREKGVCCERAAPASPAPEGEEEERARPRAPDDSPETLPSRSLDLDRAGGEGASQDPTSGASGDPPCFPCPPDGREEEEEEVPGCEKLPKEIPRGEKPMAQVEQSLKGEKASYDLYKRAS